MRRKSIIIKTFLRFGILAAVVLFPLIPFLFSNSTRKIGLTNANTEECYNLKQEKIMQEILVQGRITKLGVYFIKPQSTYEESECIQIVVRQGKKEQRKQLPCTEIKNAQINFIDINLALIEEGTAEISLVSENLSGDILVYLCRDEKSGLEGAKIGGEKKTSPLCMEYDLFVYSGVTFVSVCLFLILAVLLFVGAALIESEWKYAWKICCLLSFFAIVLTICIRQPTASFLGEPRSEAAYEFWKQAKENGFFGSILILECGLYYLSFIQRITAWIAVVISNEKYVFVVMQMMQTFFIAFCSCMVWSHKLHLNLSKMNRMLLSIIIGTCLNTTQSYYLHCMGYWGMLFIIFFSLMNMEKMHRSIYVLSTIFAMICCLSKMAYIILIPCAIFILIYKNKKLTYRNICWLVSILTGCIVQISYTVTHTSVFQSGAGLGTIQVPSLLHLINGLFYYAVQGINTFLFNSEHSNVWYSNLILLCSIFAIIVVVLYRMLHHNNKNIVYIILLGIMYFSVLGFTMLTSAGGFDMLQSINWSATKLLNHQHFAYIKILLCIILIILFQEFFNRGERNIYNICTVVFLVFISFSNMPVNNENDCSATSKVSTFPTEWKKVSYVTSNQAYYVPINVGYPFALISLTHNSYGILLGYNEEGEWKHLPMAINYPEEIKYNEAVLGDVFDTETNGILSISTKRSNTYLDAIYEIIVFNRMGQVIQRKKQCNSSDRHWIDFMFDEPLYNAYRIEFVNTTTESIGYVSEALNIGIYNDVTASILETDEKDNFIKRIDTLEDSVDNISQSQISVEYCNNELILGKDHVDILQDENASIRGWAVDQNVLLPYTEVYAVVDSCIVKGKIGIPRKDVEEAYGNSAVLNSGFIIDIPQEIIKETREISLIFIDDRYKEIRTLKINKS